LATILSLEIKLNGKTETVTAVLDPGADFTVLQPTFLKRFAVDEDACGYLEAGFDADGNVSETVPLAIATASFAGHTFPMPVQFDKELIRPCLIGRSGFQEYFRIEFDPQGAATRFTWNGESPKSTLAEVRKLIDSRIGKRPKKP
jgi:hypothetical protein